MARRTGSVVVVFAATVLLPAACGDGADLPADAGAPAFCQPVKRAFQALFGVESTAYEAYGRAARVATQNLREAEKTAPPELAEAIRGIADYYGSSAESGEPLGLSAFQEVRPHVGTLGGAVQDQCGFTIDEGETAAPG